MAKSKIVLTFTDAPAVGNYAGFGNNLVAGGVGPQETFVLSRDGLNKSAIGYDEYSSASNYVDALIADYGQNGLYNFVIAGNIVTITAMQSNVVFTVQTLTGPFSVVITNETEEIPIEIQSIVFSNNVANSCGTVLATVTTNVLATKYFTDGVEHANALNPFQYVINRGIHEQLVVEAANLTQDGEYVGSPSAISTANTNVAINNTPNGATVTVTLTYTYLLTPQYSLDGVNYTTNNVFAGILPGNYTVYVKDQYGCIINKSFTVEEFAPVTTTNYAYSYISNAMSIRFKQNQLWDNIDIFKTTANTLSCEEEVDVAYQCVQKFKPSNVVTTQFLSNYTNITANIIKEDLTKVAIPITLKKAFLDLKDRRDCNVYSLGAGKAGIFYTVGNTYDYTTGVINGSYALNGQLPEYGAIGSDVEIVGVGWFRVEDILYNEALNADVLVITYNYTGVQVVKQAKCNYNQQPFNVYEFKIDFALYTNKYIQVEVLQSKVNFDDFNYLSEVILVTNEHKNLLDVIWYNQTDADVFYSTGIKNIGNIEFEEFSNSNDSSLVINKTDNTSVIIEAVNYEAKKLVFEHVTTAIALQLSQAVLHKKLFINRAPFISQSPPELEPLTSTNLYSFTANLISTGRPVPVDPAT